MSPLDTLQLVGHYPPIFSGRNRVFQFLRAFFFARGSPRKGWGETMQYLPGWTVQCINPECDARGHWLRVTEDHLSQCSNCGAPLRNVPPPLAPSRLAGRMRPRALSAYRPRLRPR